MKDGGIPHETLGLFHFERRGLWFMNQRIKICVAIYEKSNMHLLHLLAVHWHTVKVEMYAWRGKFTPVISRSPKPTHKFYHYYNIKQSNAMNLATTTNTVT